MCIYKSSIGKSSFTKDNVWKLVKYVALHHFNANFGNVDDALVVKILLGTKPEATKLQQKEYS